MTWLRFFLVFILCIFSYYLFSQNFLQSSAVLTVGNLLKTAAGPVLDLINIPAFVYISSLLILFSALLFSVIYFFGVVRPKVVQLDKLRRAITSLPLAAESTSPQQTANTAQWHDAYAKLGKIMTEHGLYRASWAALQSGISTMNAQTPTPFGVLVEKNNEKQDVDDDILDALPGYYTSLGLILTFLGLVVALYFAARGFRTGDLEQARNAIIHLLNAASFKFLTSVAALCSALWISVFARIVRSQLRTASNHTVQTIDNYLSGWRSRMMQDNRPEVGVNRADIQQLIHSIQALQATMAHPIALQNRAEVDAK